MLFLYRPRQTRLPLPPRRPRTEQDAYNARLQERFAATQRVRPAVPAPGP